MGRGGCGDERAYIELDIEHLRHNVKCLQRALQPGCELMAVVKAQAYGHRAGVIAPHLNRMGVHAFAVATIDEGIELRECGIRGEILIFGGTRVERAGELARYELTQTVIDYAYACALEAQGIPVRVHIKVDTGMHRLGIDAGEVQRIEQVSAMEHLWVTGMYTHLCCADSLAPEDVAFSREQIARFYHLVGSLKRVGVTIPKLHIQSSYGLLNYPDLRCDYARIGLALYGVPGRPGERTVQQLALLPVLSLKTRIVLVREVKKGSSVGYNRDFVAARDSRIAILPVGYADGLPRALSCENGSVVIHGRCAPIVGKVCMDQLAVDVTDLASAKVGDLATLIGTEDESVKAPVVADRCGSISNELLSRMGMRLPVVLTHEGTDAKDEKGCAAAMDIPASVCYNLMEKSGSGLAASVPGHGGGMEGDYAKYQSVCGGSVTEVKGGECPLFGCGV